MRILYFDCFAGISGDMCLGALTDVGVEPSYVIGELAKLGDLGFQLEINRVMKKGISANQAVVTVPKEHNHRTLKDIRLIIESSGLNDMVKRLSLNIFQRLARAEAMVHNRPVEEVHFHEVGAVDSIVDIVGTAICIENLKPDRIISSVLNDGHGFVTCQHGVIPVPVPAVMHILAERGATARQIDVGYELVTPTGAAIIAELSERFGLMPEIDIEKTGYGAGSRELTIPNLLRVALGSYSDALRPITILETNIDDTIPEVLGYVMDKLLKSGANDVYFTNIQMKKNRPAIKLTVLCEENCVTDMERIIFRETSTIGIRKRYELRHVLPREMSYVPSAFGDIPVKTAAFDGINKTMPEFESAKMIAELHDVPLRSVYNAAGCKI